MADSKISALTAATALDGTEPAPIVQGGATVKVTVQAIANLYSRSDTISISSTGSQDVTFSSALPSNDYEFIKFRFKGNSGIWEELDEDAATKTTTKFTYNFPATGTLSYAVQVRS